MTKLQMEYAKLQETKRANQVVEDLTRIRDLRSHQVAVGQLQETGRHNVETERQAVAVLGESKRHNLETERQQVRTLAESSRHNLATEGIQRDTLTETQRANLAREVELNRHNLATESIQSRAQDIAESSLSETQRHNRATESETVRHSQVMEQQGARDVATRERAQLATQAYQEGQISLGYSQLAEAVRTHKANEAISQYVAATGRMSQQEQAQHNRATELQTGARLALERDIASADRASRESIAGAQLAESRRHNVESEGIAKQGQEISLFNANTQRGLAYTQGFHNVTSGIRDLTGGLRDLSGIGVDRMQGIGSVLRGVSGIINLK